MPACSRSVGKAARKARRRHGGFPAWGEVRQAVNAAGRPLTATERATVEGEIDVRVRQAVAAARRAGKLPASLRLLVEATSGRSDWRDRFRCLSDGLFRHELSWARPNRRFLPHGLYLPGAARAGIGTIAIVLDTSGSITEPELARYTGEILALLEEALPDELLLIQCGEHEKLWGAQAAAARSVLTALSLARPGYQRSNMARSVPSRARVRVCSSR